MPEPAAHEDSFQNRLGREADAKRRVATAAAADIEPRETIFVDSSTTAYQVVADVLERGIPITLLTNSLPVLSLVGDADLANVTLVGLGGQFRTLTHSFAGSDTIRAVAGYFADRVVFSVKGVSAEGTLTDPDQIEADVKRAMIGHAKTVVLLATAAKFEERGLNVIAPADRIHVAYLANTPPEGAPCARGRGREGASRLVRCQPTEPSVRLREKDARPGDYSNPCR